MKKKDSQNIENKEMFKVLSYGKILTVTRVYRNGKTIVGYGLYDGDKKECKVSASELKELLKEKKINLKNYRLTSDGRIVKGKTSLDIDDKRFSELYKRWKKDRKPFPLKILVDTIPIPSDDFKRLEKVEKVYETLSADKIGLDWISYLKDNWFYGVLSYDCTYDEFKSEMNEHFDDFVAELERKRIIEGL